MSLKKQQIENRRQFISYLRANPDQKTQIQSSELYQPYGTRFDFDAGESPKNVCTVGLALDMIKFDYTDPAVEAYSVFCGSYGLSLDDDESLGSDHPDSLLHIWHINDSQHLTWDQQADLLEKEWFGTDV